jgi:predicted nucleic acid-binding protein
MMNKHLESASRIYLDANALVYFIERSDELQEKIGRVVEFAVRADKPIYMSDIGVAECLYGAYKAQDADLEQKYNEVFYEAALFALVPVDSELIKNAARLGARHGLKLVDAVHFLTAVENACDVFITNDARCSLDGVRVLAVVDL